MPRYADPHDQSMEDRLTALPPIKPALHFVGFRGDEYRSAVRVWGSPNFIHLMWDRWAQQDMHSSDTVIFAKGTDADPIARLNYPLSRRSGPPGDT